MNKLGWIACILIFLTVTIFVVAFDNNTQTKRVKFINKNLELKNENNEIVNDSNSRKIVINETKFHNKDFNTQNSDVRFETTQNTYTTNNTNFQKSRIENSEKIDYKNLDDKNIDIALQNAKNYNYRQKEYGNYNPKYTQNNSQYDEYAFKDIDWSKWKSNFVNKILDDSVTQKYLDSYPDGAFFYYSFIVDDQGRILNISVRSIYLSDSDKRNVARFIKSFEYSPLTRFPENSKRKTARVSAIMMLSNNATVHSKPSDFNDTEHIKYKQ